MAGPGQVAPHVTGSNRNVQICTDISIYRKLPDKFPIDDLDSSYIWLFLGSGIKCHQCNSYDDYHCADPFYYADSPDKPKTDKFLKDCPDDGEDYFCRKIFQNGESVTRVSLSLSDRYGRIWESNLNCCAIFIAIQWAVNLEKMQFLIRSFLIESSTFLWKPCW